MARAQRRRRRNRRRPRRIGGPLTRVTAWIDRRMLTVVFVSLCMYVVSVNALVRGFGGDANLVSPFYLREKSEALCALLLHAALHPLRGPDQSAEQAVRDAAVRHGVQPALALAIARAESDLRPHVISRTGAMGLMQLMPATAAELGVRDPFDPEQNADGAVRYLRRLLRRYRGSVPRALAAYNTGPGRVPRAADSTLPGDTRRYVRTVLAGL